MDDELIDRLANMLVTELGKENNAIPVLKRELSRVEKGIDNMLNAIQNGVLTSSTKKRLEELEERKNELNIKIMQEQIAKPEISREVFTTWLTHFRTYDITDRDQRKRLVDHFVNVIYLYEDHFDLFLNFHEGAVSITFNEDMLKASKARKSKKTLSSDLTSSGAPTKNSFC